MSRYIDAELIPYSETKGNPKKFTIENLARKSDIDKIPTADVEPVRHGHWIVVEKYDDHKTIQCSECKWLFKVDYTQSEYLGCPMCRAKMD